ncbi:MAG: hypothetical protein AABW80_01620 [Nanoarchaeota archaeon]
MLVRFKTKGIEISARKVKWWEKGLGLMFRTRKTENLLFEFPRYGFWPMHSIFVFFNFLMVWLDSKNNIVDVRMVRPFTSVIVPKKSFKKIVELPFNKRNKGVIDLLVGKQKFK